MRERSPLENVNVQDRVVFALRMRMHHCTSHSKTTRSDASKRESESERTVWGRCVHSVHSSE
jgi:hypothetical protein